jgi:hypothetical protein
MQTPKVQPAVPNVQPPVPADFHDWIPLSEAAKLYPSPRTGRNTHPNTILRWIATGKIKGRKSRSGFWYVRRSEVIELLKPAPASGRPKALDA